MKHLSLAFFISLASLSAFANCADVAAIPSHLDPSDLEKCVVSSERIAVVDNSTGRYGFVNTAGEVVIPPTLEQAWSFQEGLAVVKKDGKWGHIRPDGTFAVPAIYDDAWGFSDGLAKVEKAKKAGFVNQKGEIVIPIKYDETEHWFNEQRAAVSINNKWGLIDSSGRLLTKLDFDSMSMPSEGLILASKLTPNNEIRYGYLNTDGKTAIAFDYDLASNFSRGTATVIKDGENYYINRYGEQVELKESYLNF
ncbi:MAG: WG repeat-containing protein [Moraxella sp.]|nr:WG repeat-containing protein [Moraxella sp.]